MSLKLIEVKMADKKFISIAVTTELIKFLFIFFFISVVMNNAR